MAGKTLNKIMGFLGLEDEYDDEVEEVEENDEDTKEIQFTPKNSKNQSKVVSIHTSSAKVNIVRPAGFEEAASVCDDVKNRKIVVVNITEMDPKTAQRFLDFLGGTSYALAGNLEEIEKGVYIISPSNVEVTNELKSELSTGGIFDWSK